MSQFSNGIEAIAQSHPRTREGFNAAVNEVMSSLSLNYPQAVMQLMSHWQQLVQGTGRYGIVQLPPMDHPIDNNTLTALADKYRTCGPVRQELMNIASKGNPR